MNISVIMPIIGAIGVLVIVVVILVVKSGEKRDRIKSVAIADFNSFAEEMRQDNIEIKRTLENVKEKVEAIDKMMNEI